MNLRYLSGAIISIPLLPLMYYQAKKIRDSVPRLPEAKGKSGLSLTENKSAKQISLLFIGESTIAGVGVQTHEQGFAGTFAQELSKLKDINISWKVYARSGNTVKKVNQKLLAKITDEQADLLVIGLGANDAFTLNSPSKWNKEIRRLIKSLQQKYPSATILFCNMPPIKEFPAFTSLIKFTIGNLVEILGEEVKGIVDEFDNVFYCEEKLSLNEWIQKSELKLDPQDFFSDGIHPSKLTYQIWAKEVAKEYVNLTNDV